MARKKKDAESGMMNDDGGAVAVAVVEREDPRGTSGLDGSAETGVTGVTEDTIPDVRFVPVDQIALDYANHRHPSLADEAAIGRLADSIRDHGLRQPILVCERDGTDGKTSELYTLVYGHRRLAAVKLLGTTRLIKAEIRPPMAAAEVLTLRAIENLHREDLNPMETVIAVEQMAERFAGDPDTIVDHISAELGQTKDWVRDRLYLRRIGGLTRELALAGLLPAGHLRELCKLGDELEQAALAVQALNGSYWVHNGRGHDAKKLKAVIDGLIKEADQAGRVARKSVDDVRRMVQELQRSLRLVPWLLDRPFGAFPACEGCEHNTRTDVTLFGPASEDDAGKCLNAGCFSAKLKAAEADKEKAVRLVVKGKDAGAGCVTAATPDHLKPAAVQREAKKRLAPAPGPPGSGGEKGGGGKGKGSGGKGKSAELIEAERKAKLVNSFSNKMDKWREGVQAQICRAVEPRGAWQTVGRMLLMHTKMAHEWLWWTPRPHVYEWSMKVEVPKLPRPQLTLEEASAVRRALGGDSQSILELVQHHEMFSGVASEELCELTPAVLLAMARELGLTVEEPPAWGGFQEEKKAEAQATGPKVVKKKVGKRKKK